MGFLPLKEWHQGPSVIDNKRVVFFLHGNLPLLYIFTIQRLFHGLKFFRKNYGGPFHLFGSNSPITRPLFTFLWGLSLRPSCCGSFKPSSCGATNSSSEEEFDVDSSPSTSYAGLSFKDIRFAFLTSSSSITTSSTKPILLVLKGVYYHEHLLLFLSFPRTQHLDS